MKTTNTGIHGAFFEGIDIVNTENEKNRAVIYYIWKHFDHFQLKVPVSVAPNFKKITHSIPRKTSVSTMCDCRVRKPYKAKKIR